MSKRKREEDLFSMLVNEKTSFFEDTSRDERVPLPGFDNSLSCKICKMALNEELSSKVRITPNGMSLLELFDFAQEEFQRDEGRPSMDIAQDVVRNIHLFARHAQGLETLADTTTLEVFRHFKYDHAQKRKQKIKERLSRILLNMIEIGIQSLCEKGQDGTLLLDKRDTTLVLNIIDRLHKISSIKENDILT